MPVVYTCVIILPLSYIVGLVYSLKTHKAHIYDKFVSDVDQSESIIAYITECIFYMHIYKKLKKKVTWLLFYTFL